MAELQIRGQINLSTVGNGDGDPLLARDASSGAIGVNSTALTMSLTAGQLIVGNASNVATATTITGDVTINSSGVTAIGVGVIVNNDINASAAIALSKLAATTASRALVSDGSGLISPGTTTATEIGYVSGVTSAIQTQLNTKQATITGGATTITSLDLTSNRALISSGAGKVAVSSVTNTELGYVSGVTSAIQTQLDARLAVTVTSAANGDIVYYNGASWVNLARGTNGQALYSTGTTIQWDTPTINGIPIGGTIGQVLAKQSGTDFDADWETLTVASIPEITATAAELNILDGATISTTELNYLDNVSSSIQTQLDGKLSTALAQNALFVGNASNVATPLAAGTSGYILTSVSGVPTWATPAIVPPPGSDTQVIFNDGGSFGADSGMVFNKTTNTLTVGRVVGVPTGTLAGLNTGSVASSDPSSLSDFDVWGHSGSQTIRARMGGSTRQIPYTVDMTIGAGSIPFFPFANQAQVSYENAFTYSTSTNVLAVDTLSATSTTEAGIRFNPVTADPSSLSNGYAWYNSTSNQLKARINGATVALGTGDVVGPASSVDNAIARYDSTTGKLIQDSSVFVSDTADLTLGSASLSGDRTISASASGDSGIIIQSKGVGYTSVRSDGSSGNLLLAQTAIGTDVTGTGAMTIFTSAASGATNTHDLRLNTGNTATGTSGSIYLNPGAASGAGVDGNVGFFTTSGSFGSGEKVIFVTNAATVPSGTPSGGGILYVESGALKYKGSSGTITTLGVA